MSFANVSQVEVDKGPQGTLFGRNATGGLIQIKTKDPIQEFSGSAAITYGNYRTIGTDEYITGGITNYLAADLAFHYQDQGQGYGRNIVTGEDVDKTRDVALRNKWLFTPSGETEIKLILDFERSNIANVFTSAPGTTPVGGPTFTGNPQDIANYYQPYGTLNQWGASIHVRQGIEIGQLLSTTAYRHLEMDCLCGGSLAIDPAESYAPIFHEVHHQFSQEFQLVSPEDSKVKWAAGAFFFDALSALQPVTLYGPASTLGGTLSPYQHINITADQRAVSGALYAQGTLEVLPATNLTVGARYTYERRSIVVGEIGVPYPGYEAYAFTLHDNPDPISFKKPTWRLALDHHFSPDLMGHISYNRGFKSGGFNDFSVPTQAFLAETLDAYEVGTKADLFSKRLQINTSAFLYNYKNMQNAVYFGQSEYIYNSSAAKLYGLDLDGRFSVTRALALTASAEWLHTYYVSFPDANFSVPIPGGGNMFTKNPPLGAKGHHLPLAPDATFSIGADYTIDTAVGDVILNVTDAYNSRWFGEPDNRLQQSSYNLVNAQVLWNSEDKTDSVSFWGKNLTNRNYLTAVGSAQDGDFAAFAAPRTYGVTVSKKF